VSCVNVFNQFRIGFLTDLENTVFANKTFDVIAYITTVTSCEFSQLYYEQVMDADKSGSVVRKTLDLKSLQPGTRNFEFRISKNSFWRCGIFVSALYLATKIKINICIRLIF